MFDNTQETQRKSLMMFESERDSGIINYSMLISAGMVSLIYSKRSIEATEKTGTNLNST
jgi:hypothetical protein